MTEPSIAPQVADEPQPDRLKETLREIAETLILAAVIYLIVNFFTIRCEVDGPSMEPTLQTGQRLVVYRLAYAFGEPERGDVIVFRSSNNPDDDLVKRIIGLPGETVSIQGGRVYINGELLAEPSFIPSAAYDGTWEVPEGHYFVLGDNRNSSSDSHSWGTIAAGQILGRAWLSYWPPGRWGGIQHYRGYNMDADSP